MPSIANFDRTPGCSVSVNGPTLTVNAAAGGTSLFWSAQVSDHAGNPAGTQCITAARQPWGGWMLLAGLGALLALGRSRAMPARARR